MENKWGIKISRIALPEEKLSYEEWVKMLNVSTNYKTNKELNHSYNKFYNFSKIKNKTNESTNTGA
jgi:hypothetical protein